ncbi:MAG: hypothetical protein K0S53_830 [Bacteroidetes bacterium]|jgi:hypothetical protein|nr:hypothetical protein [Bacteroidota bacterium]MDF2451459.1 hypothetical protein [Bacteroidota bacterium]
MISLPNINKKAASYDAAFCKIMLFMQSTTLSVTPYSYRDKLTFFTSRMP